MGNFNNKEFRIHLICWVVYIFVEVILAGFIAGKFSSFYLYVLFYVLNIGTFYFHALWVMPLLNRKAKNRVLVFILAVILECTIYLVLATLINLSLELAGLRGNPLVINLKYLGISFWRGKFFLMYATGYFFLKRYLARKEDENQKALEIERLRFQLIVAEKDFLRAQINPHLLFNTLNYIRYATKHNTANAALAIKGLTDLMEYALEETKIDFVPLNSEIVQVENLIRLNRLRFEHLLNLNYTKDIQKEDATILPIILLTLVENMFKHGILNDPSHPATIEINSSATEIYFKSRNLAKLASEPAGLKSGLRNITARLGHAYPGDYVFVYGLRGSYFEAELRIKLV